MTAKPVLKCNVNFLIPPQKNKQKKTKKKQKKTKKKQKKNKKKAQ